MKTLPITGLRPMTGDDLKLVTAAFHRHPPELSEFTFTNLHAWRARRQIMLATAGDSLVFFIETERGQKILFGPPFGPDDPAKVIAGISPEIAGACRIPERLAPVFEQHGLAMRHDRDNDDYLYRVEDLATLAGRKFAKKRNQIKHCLATNDCAFEPIGEKNIAECLAMQDLWCDIRGCRNEPGLDGEDTAIREAFALFGRIDLLGGLIRIGGRVGAYALAERLNHDTAVWHFEKALPEISGLGQLINHWFARQILAPAGFAMVNREQDLGIEGLRQAKESYHPAGMARKFTSLPAAQSVASLS